MFDGEQDIEASPFFKNCAFSFHCWFCLFGYLRIINDHVVFFCCLRKPRKTVSLFIKNRLIKLAEIFSTSFALYSLNLTNPLACRHEPSFHLQQTPIIQFYMRSSHLIHFSTEVSTKTFLSKVDSL